MEPISAVLVFWAIVWICKNAAEDVMGAVKGRPSPRRVKQLKRIEAEGGTPGYGFGGFAHDFWDDFLQARTAKRRELAAKGRESVGPTEVPEPEVKPVGTFTPQAEDPPTPVAASPDDTDRRVDPLRLDGRNGNTESHDRETTPATEEAQPISPTPTAQVIPIFRTPNSTPNQQEVPPMTTEVTGLTTAIDYANGVAQAHQSHAADAETFAASLASNEVGDGTIGLAVQAQEASSAAGAAWSAVADALNDQTGVKEAYEATPDAGSREFVTSE